MTYTYKKPKVLLIILYTLLVTSATRAQSWVPVGNPYFTPDTVYSSPLALDSSGTPYVVFHDESNNNKASVMKFNGSSWVNVGNAGFSTGSVFNEVIAIARDNTLYVGYIDYASQGKVTVMTYNGSSWVPVGNVGLSADSAINLSLAISRSGMPYVLYADRSVGYKATMMKFNGSTWTTVGTAGFGDTLSIYSTLSIAIDNNDMPYVLYNSNASVFGLNVLKYNGSGWTTLDGPTIGSATQTGAIAIDKNNIPYVAYPDGFDLAGNAGPAMVTKYTGSSWVTVGSGAISDGIIGRTIYMAIDKDNSIYVLYDDYTGGFGTSVRKYNGAAWTSLGPNSFSGMQTESTSIAVDSSGVPYIAYIDDRNRYRTSVLKYPHPVAVNNIAVPTGSSIIITPNPNSGSFTLETVSPFNEHAMIIITNVLGEVVKEQQTTTNNDAHIKLNCSPGLYFVTAVTAHGKQTVSLILQ